MSWDLGTMRRPQTEDDFALAQTQIIHLNDVNRGTAMQSMISKI